MNTLTDCIFDVDGVFTNGQFLYSKEGKEYKTFGPEDADALKIFKKYINVTIVSGDYKGIEISKSRIKHLGFDLQFVSTFKRLSWIKENFNIENVIYMGDSFMDIPILNGVNYSIAPQNRNKLVDPYCNYITEAKGGEGAVAEACFHILKEFFNISIPLETEEELSIYFLN